LRTKEGKEVDFCLTDVSGIQEIIEVKYRDANVSNNLFHFTHKYNLKGTQIVKELKRERRIDQIDVRHVVTYLNELML
jgi:hypothetical protein